MLCFNDFDSFQFGFSSAAKTPPCFLRDPYRTVHTAEVDEDKVYGVTIEEHSTLATWTTLPGEGVEMTVNMTRTLPGQYYQDTG